MTVKKWIRMHLEAAPASVTMAFCLFMGLIGFNPQLAYGDVAPAPPDPADEWVIPPGSWSGTLADRLQALGYEIVSLDLDADFATAVFDDGRALSVDLATGAFWVVDDREQEIMSGTVDAGLVDDDVAEVDLTFEFADDPGVEHVLDGTLVADASSNGHVVLEGTLDAEAVDESIDLTQLSHHPEGMGFSVEGASYRPPVLPRAVDAPPGVVDGETVGDLTGDGTRSWLALAAGVLVVIAAAVLGITWASYKCYAGKISSQNAQIRVQLKMDREVAKAAYP